MATKSNDRQKGRRKNKAGGSLATYVDRRDARIAHYYFVRRVVKPAAIYDYLLRECRECLRPDVGSSHDDPNGDAHTFTPLVSGNRASGLRAVQATVMRLRADARPQEILDLRRPIETEKVRKTLEYLLQKAIEVIEDNAFINVEKVAPSGDVVTVREPRYSKQDKARATKAAASLAEKIGKLTGARFEPVDDDEADKASRGKGSEIAAEPYTFSFPHATGGEQSLDTMIAMNIERTKVN